jgi:hypothetical protein
MDSSDINSTFGDVENRGMTVPRSGLRRFDPHALDLAVAQGTEAGVLVATAAGI